MNKKIKSQIENILGILILIFIIIAFAYYLLGSLGLLPDYFYEQCKNIDKETAIKRGCCEDRDMRSPVSWFFGESNCNRYLNNSFTKK